jgi:hypothetical protein
MISTESKAAEFSSTEETTLVEYQPVNRFATASLVTGLLSATALAHPLLWAVPTLTVVLAWIALRQISKSKGEQRGEFLAKSAMALALLFASWSISWFASDFIVLSAEARRCADTWLNRVRDGRLYEAHQLTLQASQRVKGDEPIEEVYQQTPNPVRADAVKKDSPGDTPDMTMKMMRQELPTLYQQFIVAPPMSKIISLKKDWQFTFVRTISITHSSQYSIYMLLEYEIRPSSNSGLQPLRVVLDLESERAGKEARWRVSQIAEPSYPPR